MLDLNPFREYCIQSPFMIRDLLPCWVRVERWWIHSEPDGALPGWAGAAESLRSVLEYASLWISATSIVTPRATRQLTGAEVQALHSYFKQREAALSAITGNENIKNYLTWLEEDAKLAQQVADAWNAST